MKGSRIRNIGIKNCGHITLTCISPEARDLLDKLCSEFERQQKKHIRTLNGYQALYWACRYSGLIEGV